MSELALALRALASARARGDAHEIERMEERVFELRQAEPTFRRFKHANGGRPRHVADEQAAMLAVVTHRRECHDNATHKGCTWPGVAYGEAVVGDDGTTTTRQRRMGGPCTPERCRHCKDALTVRWNAWDTKRALLKQADQLLGSGKPYEPTVGEQLDALLRKLGG